MAKGSKQTGNSLNQTLLEAVLEAVKCGYMQVEIPALDLVVDLRTGKVYRQDKNGFYVEQALNVCAGHLYFTNIPVHVLVAFCTLQYNGLLAGKADEIKDLISQNKLAVCHADGDGTNNQSQNVELSDEFHNEKNRALIYGLQQWYPALYTKRQLAAGALQTQLVLKGQSIGVEDIDAFLKHYTFGHMPIPTNTAGQNTVREFIAFMHKRRPYEWDLAPELTEEEKSSRSRSRRVKNPTAEMMQIDNFWRANQLFKSQREFADFAKVSESNLSDWLSGKVSELTQKRHSEALWHVLYLRSKALGKEFKPDGKTPDQIKDITGEA